MTGLYARYMDQWERKLDRLADYLDATASENDNIEDGKTK